MADSLLAFVSVDVDTHVSLNCATAGPEDGPLVVLLHGFPEFWFAWRDYVRPLAERGFRVVAPDQRGCNLSDKPEGLESYRLDRLAADVFALATALGRERFHVVGDGAGAAVAWTMAGLDPKRLTSAAMIQAPHPALWRKALRSVPEPRRRLGLDLARLPALSEWRVRLGNFSGFAREFRTAARPDAFPPDILDVYREAWRRPGALAAMLTARRALLDEDPPVPQPRSLKAPTLILWGDRDDRAPARLADLSATLCVNARVRHVPQATRWIIHDAPELVRDALLDHL